MRCFIIQPFDDGGPFDQRCEEVLKPAITKADLEPYRVDHDPAVSIPIESIERGIQSSEVCLADISTDNPNVWFEVGYGIAAKKEVVFICSAARPTAFPFDVQHRNITRYSTESPRDFEKLQRSVTQRLKALIKSKKDLGIVGKLSPTQETEGLAPHEVAALIVLAEECLAPDDGASTSQMRDRMMSAGFTGVAVGIALSSLRARSYIDYAERQDGYDNSYSVCVMTPKGFHWLQDNQSLLVLRRDEATKVDKKATNEPVEISDEDIPF